MSRVKFFKTLQIDQNTSYLRRMWRIEHIGWAVFLFLLLLAGLGLTGGYGPLNTTRKTNALIEVDYQPFARRSAQTALDFTLKQLQGRKASLVIQQELLNKYQIQQITPEPAEVTADGRLVTYTFEAEATAESIDVSLLLKPDGGTIGSVAGKAGASVDSFVAIKQFVYP